MHDTARAYMESIVEFSRDALNTIAAELKAPRPRWRVLRDAALTLCDNARALDNAIEIVREPGEAMAEGKPIAPPRPGGRE